MLYTAGLRLLVLPIALFAATAQAVIGTDVQNNVADIPGPAVCRIFFLDKDAHVESLCSGTLIEPAKVLTATHCVDGVKPTDKIEVTCGFQGVDETQVQYKMSNFGTKIMVAGALFSQAPRTVVQVQVDNGISDTSRPDDIAVLTLDAPAGIAPVPVETNSIAASHCFVNGEVAAAGYGYDNEVVAGTLSSSFFHASALRRSGYQEYFFYVESLPLPDISDQEWQAMHANKNEQERLSWEFVIQSKRLNASIMPGDSGGPVFCRENPAAPFKMIGTASASQLEVHRGDDRKVTLSYTNIWSELAFDHLVSLEYFEQTGGWDVRNAPPTPAGP